jgi:hypothetical protein
VDLFHGALNGDAVYPTYVDILVLLLVIGLFVYAATLIPEKESHEGNLKKGYRRNRS